MAGDGNLPELVWLPWAYLEEVVVAEPLNMDQMEVLGLQFTQDDYDQMIQEGRNWDKYRKKPEDN